MPHWADPFLAERIAENLRRAVRAFDRSTHLRSESHRLRDQLRRHVRGPEPPAPHSEIVWTSLDQTVVCRITARAASLHEVEVSVNGDCVARRVFDDPVEAADEASRQRREFGIDT